VSSYLLTHVIKGRSALIVPISAKQRTLGVIAIVWVSEENRFSDFDVQLLNGISSQVAVALEKDRLAAEVLRLRRELNDARAGERIIGGVVLHDEGNGEYYVHRLFIAPDFQKQGAASQALASIEATFPARRWTLHTPHLSDDNHRFYERRGYRKFGEVRLDEPGLPEGFLLFHYEKIMPPQAGEG